MTKTRRFDYMPLIVTLALLLLTSVPHLHPDALGARQTMQQTERLNEYIFEVGAFHKLRVLDNVNVVYRCVPDSAGFAAYRGEEDFRDAFIFTNNNGTLRVQVTTEDINKPGLPTIYLYSDYLTEAENSSIFTLTIENPAPCAEFKVRQEGNGTIIADGINATKVTAALATGMGNVIVAGTCTNAELKMVGTGVIQADRLKARSVKCTIIGSGSIGCWAEEKLSVKGIGSTKIYYKGNPEVKKTGGGKLYPVAAATTSSPAVTPEEDEE